MAYEQRTRFIREFEAFSSEAKLTEKQTESLLLAYAIAQVAKKNLFAEWDRNWSRARLNAQIEKAAPPGLNSAGLTEQERVIEADMRQRFASILEPAQVEILQRRGAYIALRHVAALGFHPIDVRAD